MRQNKTVNFREKQSFSPGGAVMMHDVLTAPKGKKMEGFGRGLKRGIGTDAGAGVGSAAGVSLGWLLGALLATHKLSPQSVRKVVDSTKGFLTSTVGGGLLGGAAGGYGGFKLGDRIAGKPSWQAQNAPAGPKTSQGWMARNFGYGLLGKPNLAKNSSAKSAGIVESLQNAATGIADRPALTAGLAGAGIGAGIAGVSSLTSEEKRKRMLRNMLMGAAAGGAVGTGSQMASSKLRSMTPSGALGKDLQSLVDLLPADELAAAAGSFKPGTKKASFVKQAVPAGAARGVMRPLLEGLGKHTGRFLDTVGRGAKGGLGWSFGKSPVGTILGAPLLGSAGLEGLAAAAKHPHWSPELQYYRDAASDSIFDRVLNFYKRPVQSVFGSRSPLPPEQLLQRAQERYGRLPGAQERYGKLPGAVAKYTGVDATGKPQFSYSGSGSLDVPEYIQRALQKARELNRMYTPAGSGTGRTTTPTNYRSHYFNLQPNELF